MFRIYERDLDPEFRLYCDRIHRNPVTPPHVNYYAEIVLCLQGVLRIKVNCQERILHSGDGTLIHSMEVHEFLTGQENQVLIFCFSPALFRDILDGSSSANGHVGTLSTETMNFLFYLIKKELSYPEHLREIRLVLQTLLYEIPCPKPETEQTLAICRAMSYLAQHFAEEITLEQLSKAIGVNRVYASKMFSKYLNGVTFTNVLSHIRLNRAIRLLGQTTVAQAALESGFGSVRQFNRIFKKVTGQTPREYRVLEDHTIDRRTL